MFKIIAFFIVTLFARLYVRVAILLTCGKHVHDHIVSLEGKVWAHEVNTATFFCAKTGKWAVIYLFGRVLILPLSVILMFYFGIVPTGE